MSFIDIFLIGIALSMDAFAVSICKGLSVKKVSAKHVLTVGVYFGGFQFLMPVIGYLLGFRFEHLITNIDHWIAFFVFMMLGLKVISDSLKECDCREKLSKTLSLKVLFMIGVATSIDAFVSGSMLYFIKAPVWSSALLIGAVTFVNACIGFNFCRMFKKVPTKYLEISSGIILITLGCKVLWEHTMQ